MGLKFSNSELVRVCKFTNIYDWISKLEHGFDTKVGEKGMTFWVNQRILLLKQFCKMWIDRLDEVTSALDDKNSRIINQLFKKLVGKITIILVTHKISDIDFANNYIFVENRKVKEFKSYNDLLKKIEENG